MYSFDKKSDATRHWMATLLTGVVLFPHISQGVAATLQNENLIETYPQPTAHANPDKVNAAKRLSEVVQSIDWATVIQAAMQNKIQEAMKPFGWELEYRPLPNPAVTTKQKLMDASLSPASRNKCLNAAALEQGLGLPNKVLYPYPSLHYEKSLPKITEYVRDNNKIFLVLGMTFAIEGQPQYELQFNGWLDCFATFSVLEPPSDAGWNEFKPPAKKQSSLYPEPTADVDPARVAAAKRFWDVVQSIDWATVNESTMQGKIRNAMLPYGWQFEYLELPDPAVTTIEKRMVSSLATAAYRQCPNAAAVSAGMGLPNSVLWTEPNLHFETSKPKIEKFIYENYKTPGVLGMTYSIAGQPQYELRVFGQLDCFYEYSIFYKAK
ncbi:MAG: hypothetical protein H7293_05860 [Candidatus Saccharibacteria bacterium]|nr:hypothetical protein [Rhodoferax sp.]